MAAIRKSRISALDAKTYNTNHSNISPIIAVGYRVNSERAVQFRKLATRVLEEFTIKSYTTDDERLKGGGSILSESYFEEQLKRVREIRLSERKFYATSIDHDVTAQATKRSSRQCETSCRAESSWRFSPVPRPSLSPDSLAQYPLPSTRYLFKPPIPNT